jgi:hypothetical protein
MSINEEKNSTLFRNVGRRTTTICKIIGPDDSTPGNKDPEAIGRMGLWPSFYPDSMDPKKVLWGYPSHPSGIGYGSKHHLRLNNQYCLVAFDDEGTAYYIGGVPNSSGQEQQEGYSQYAEDTNYPTTQSSNHG